MKTSKFLTLGIFMVSSLAMTAFLLKEQDQTTIKQSTKKKKGCVFRTIFEGEDIDSNFIYKTPQKVVSSLDQGITWLIKAQQPNGGWGAGSHTRQDIIDPHAVKTDPATTSMVCIALMRNGSTLTYGEYSTHLNKAVQYLLTAVENSPSNSSNITTETGTQIQTKLGANIDVIMTAQFFSNLMDNLDHDPKLKSRVKKCLDVCVQKIQSTQDNDGSFTGSGWAGVLQSSLANNALESAQLKGAHVDSVVLDKSRNYQKGNFNTKTGEVETEKGAGVVLYAVTSSTRASAKDARKVEENFKKAKQEGKLSKDDQLTSENLEKIGYNKNDAMKASTSYNVYRSAKAVSQDEKVLSGFGNNGGEEFLSYLQTGESMIINKDVEWKKWYDNTSGRLLTIQNNDGSWNGHHCITSPVFCTATCVLILSVNNDIDKLLKIGEN